MPRRARSTAIDPRGDDASGFGYARTASSAAGAETSVSGLRTPLPTGRLAKRNGSSRGATPSINGAGMASVRVLGGTMSVRAVGDSSLFPPSSSGGGGGGGGAGLGKVNNVALALDPQLPAALARSNPLWHWLLANLFILGLYTAAFVFAGTALPVPSWSDSNDRLTLIGWGAHLLGALIFILNMVAVIVKRGPFFPMILLAYFVSLVCFVVGSVLHTTHLGLSVELAKLAAARNATVVVEADPLADGGAASDSGARSSLTDSLFGGGDESDLSVMLQWAGGLSLWLLMGVLVWRAPRSSANIADTAQVAKHKLLLELRQLAQFNIGLAAQMEAEEEAAAAAAAAGGTGAPVPPSPSGTGPPLLRGPSGLQLLSTRKRAVSGAGAATASVRGTVAVSRDDDDADILTIEERPMTGTFGFGSAPSGFTTPRAGPAATAIAPLSGGGSASSSRPVTSTGSALQPQQLTPAGTPRSAASQPQPQSQPQSSASNGEFLMRAQLQREALAIQEALDEEARYM